MRVVAACVVAMCAAGGICKHAACGLCHISVLLQSVVAQCIVVGCVCAT